VLNGWRNTAEGREFKNLYAILQIQIFALSLLIIIIILSAF
jgi:hypothetical protein